MMRKTVVYILLAFLFPVCFSCSENRRMDVLRADLTAYVDTLDAKVGIALITSDNDTLTVGNEERYPLMSVFKFHQALAVLDCMDRNHIPLDSAVCISAKDVAPDTYSPLKDKYPNGDISLPVSEMLKYTVQWSDNIACDILFDRFVSPSETDSFIKSKVDTEEFDIRFNEAQMAEKRENMIANSSTPYAAALILKDFYDGKILSAENTGFLKNLMTETETGKQRLPAPLAVTNAVVGHKTGTGPKNPDGTISAVNDIGFVECPNGKHYIIAVLIKDANMTLEETEKVIATVSEKCFFRK